MAPPVACTGDGRAGSQSGRHSRREVADGRDGPACGRRGRHGSEPGGDCSRGAGTARRAEDGQAAAHAGGCGATAWGLGRWLTIQGLFPRSTVIMSSARLPARKATRLAGPASRMSSRTGWEQEIGAIQPDPSYCLPDSFRPGIRSLVLPVAQEPTAAQICSLARLAMIKSVGSSTTSSPAREMIRTKGALNYYAPRGMPGGRPPAWAASMTNPVTIGAQVYGTAGSTVPNRPSRPVTSTPSRRTACRPVQARHRTWRNLGPFPPPPA